MVIFYGINKPICAQDVRTGFFKETDEALKDANNVQAAVSYFQKATQATQIVELTFQNLMKVHSDVVRAYLFANKSMDPSQIEAIGYVESKPIANNETAEGRAKNRRIDIVIHTQSSASSDVIPQ